MKDARLRVLRLAHRDDLDPATAQIRSADPFRVELRLPVGHQRHLNAEMTPRYDTSGVAWRASAWRARRYSRLAHRARDDRVRDGGIAVGPLTHEGPQNCDRLEGLAQAHVVGKDAPAPVKVAHAHQACRRATPPTVGGGGGRGDRRARAESHSFDARAGHS